jgi:diguanylate cyclase (GGDEF)-like protein
MKNMIDNARTSLRFRMILGMSVMLLPLLVLGIGSLLSTQRVVAAMEVVAETERNELQPVMDLQRLVLQAAMPPNDYLILGGTYERAAFELFVHQVDEVFAVLLASKIFQEPGEKALVDEAHASWEAARVVGSELMMTGRGADGAASGRRMKVFDEHIDRSVSALNRLYIEIRREIAQQQDVARGIERGATSFIGLTLLAAVVIAVVSGFLLSRSIILPIRALQDGVFRFSRGDHSFRVSLDRGDEFGHLAQTLNAMASRLELDSLTGVYNRAEFDRRLTSEVERTQRYGHVLTLLMIDVDRFKQVNDLHGHQAGDEVLRIITTRLAQELRAADTLARYGGEEFVIIMPETGSQGVQVVAERLRSAIAARPVVTSTGLELRMTVSIGCATTPQDVRSRDDLVAAADAALYAAKAAGRDRVVSYSPGLPAAPRPPA